MYSTTTPLPVWTLPPDDWDALIPLVDAYSLPDYEGLRTGEGVYVDLYVGPTNPAIEAQGYARITVGRLWTNGTAIGLLHLPAEDSALYTETALRLRLMRRDGIDPRAAFDSTATEFDTGPVFNGALDDIADPDIELNSTI